MIKHPLSILQENDPALLAAVNGSWELAIKDGGMPAKYKLLTAMALDAASGAAGGVKALAQQAMAAGATKDEVFETLRVVYHICGAGSMYTAAAGLDGVFEGKTV